MRGRPAARATGVIASGNALSPGNCRIGAMATIKVFGADWCPMTNRTREHLQHLGVDYEYINVERDRDASEWVKEQNAGKEQKPTLLIDREVLRTPSNEELDAALARAA
jgi:glutaredoxin